MWVPQDLGAERPSSRQLGVPGIDFRGRSGGSGEVGPPQGQARTSLLTTFENQDPPELGRQQSLDLTGAGYRENRRSGYQPPTEIEQVERLQEQNRRPLPGGPRIAPVSESNRDPRGAPILSPGQNPTYRGSFTRSGVVLEGYPQDPSAWQRAQERERNRQDSRGTSFGNRGERQGRRNLQDVVADYAEEYPWTGSEAEMLRELTTRNTPEDRPYEGPLVFVSDRTGEIFLDRGERTKQPDSSGDPDTLEGRRSNGPVIGMKRLDPDAPRQGIRPMGTSWSGSGFIDTPAGRIEHPEVRDAREGSGVGKYPTIATSVDLPYANKDGSVSMKRVRPFEAAKVIEGTQEGSGSRARSVPARLEDGRIVSPDAARSSETQATLSSADVARVIRDENTTPVMAKDRLNQLWKEGRAVELTPEERAQQGQKSTLVGYVDGKGVYSPKRPLLLSQEVPKGDFNTTRTKPQPGFRIGDPRNRNPEGVRRDALEEGLLGAAIVPGGAVRRVPSAYLDTMEKDGTRFLVQDQGSGEIREMGSWKEAFSASRGDRQTGVFEVLAQRPGYQEPTRLRAVVSPGAGEGAPPTVKFLMGDENSREGYIGPAVFSPDQATRRKGEAMGGSLERQMAEIIAAGGPLEIGYSGGTGTIRQVLQNVMSRNSRLPAGDPQRVDVNGLVEALLQSSKNETSREAVLQAVQEIGSPPRNFDGPTRVGRIMGNQIPQGDPLRPGTEARYPGSDEFTREDIAGEISDARAFHLADIAEQLEYEASQAALERAKRSNEGDGRDAYDAAQALAEGGLSDFEYDAGSLASQFRGGVQETISKAELALAPGNPMAPYMEYAMGLLGGIDDRMAPSSAEAIKRAQAKVAQDVAATGRNITVQDFQDEVARQVEIERRGMTLERGDPKLLEQAFYMVDAALRDSPERPLDALEKMAGGRFGRGDLAGGRAAAADRIRAKYPSETIDAALTGEDSKLVSYALDMLGYEPQSAQLRLDLPAAGYREDAQSWRNPRSLKADQRELARREAIGAALDIVARAKESNGEPLDVIEALAKRGAGRTLEARSKDEVAFGNQLRDYYSYSKGEVPGVPPFNYKKYAEASRSEKNHAAFERFGAKRLSEMLKAGII